MTPNWYTPPVYRVGTGLEIISGVARLHGMNVNDLRGPKRDSATCTVRWRAMRALKDGDFSLSAIGRLLNRNHSTVMHGLRRAG